MRKILSLPTRAAAVKTSAVPVYPVARTTETTTQRAVDHAVLQPPKAVTATQPVATKRAGSRVRTPFASVDPAAEGASEPCAGLRPITIWADRALEVRGGRFVALQKDTGTGHVRVGFIAEGTRNLVWRSIDALAQQPGSGAWLKSMRQPGR